MSKYQSFDEEALKYHDSYPPGKISVTPTKPLTSQRDLSLAYSPGVAAPCMEIYHNPSDVYKYTSRGNLIAIISNGTAVLGLGNIGPLASKPVMEGKAVLIKRFADINTFDIEINAKDPETFINAVKPLEPTFSAIMMEDVKAPDCFIIEEKLQKLMNIPVFHDDQHGTAIVTAAALTNALYLSHRKFQDIKLVCIGAGAAALSCLKLITSLGTPPKNIFLFDSHGLVQNNRTNINSYKKVYSQDASYEGHTLSDCLKDADVALGLSAANTLTLDMVKQMKPQPIIFALANPTPEIDPNLVKEHIPDAIIATGRSDFPNQVNNVLCFPFLMRGAIDVGATTINQEMMFAAVNAIAELARSMPPVHLLEKYRRWNLTFGPNYLVPMPFDLRLLNHVAPKVAEAAIKSGVATREIHDIKQYKESLDKRMPTSRLVMFPMYVKAVKQPKRILFADGQNSKILTAAQIIISEKIGKPILIGNKQIIAQKIQELNLDIQLDKDVQCIDPLQNPNFEKLWKLYFSLTQRKGINIPRAQQAVRKENSLLGALLLHTNIADALICGLNGQYKKHLNYLTHVFNPKLTGTISMINTRRRTFFIGDLRADNNVSAETLAEVTLLAADVSVKGHFGFEPHIALIGNSNFGTNPDKPNRKMQHVLKILLEKRPNLSVDGEMSFETALNPELRKQYISRTTLQGNPNLFIFPTGLAASCASQIIINTHNVLEYISPITLGLKKSAQIVASETKLNNILDIVAYITSDENI